MRKNERQPAFLSDFNHQSTINTLLSRNEYNAYDLTILECSRDRPFTVSFNSLTGSASVDSTLKQTQRCTRHVVGSKITRVHMHLNTRAPSRELTCLSASHLETYIR